MKLLIMNYSMHEC